MSMGRQQGMTLIELLIATAVMTIMAGMGFMAVYTLIEAADRIDDKERQLRKENIMMTQISRDVSLAISNQQGGAIGQDFQGDGLRFELTRFEQSLSPNWEQTDQPLGDVIQVAWYVRGGTLYRSQRPAVQKHNNQAWQTQAMLEIKYWHCEYLDFSGQWMPTWPLNGQVGQIPKQVKCRVTAEDDRVSQWLLTPWQAT